MTLKNLLNENKNTDTFYFFSNIKTIKLYEKSFKPIIYEKSSSSYKQQQKRQRTTAGKLFKIYSKKTKKNKKIKK